MTFKKGDKVQYQNEEEVYIVKKINVKSPMKSIKSFIYLFTESKDGVVIIAPSEYFRHAKRGK